MKIFTLIILIAILPTVSVAVEIDGDFWRDRLGSSNKMGRGLKLMYLRGIGDVAPLYTQDPRSYVPKISYDEMVSKVDQFYDSPPNRVIPVTHVLEILAAQAKNEDPVKIQATLFHYRKIFNERRKKE